MCGDNIYERLPTGSWRTLENPHHDEDHAGHDLAGRNALISEEFYYFGHRAFLPDGGWQALLGAPLVPARTFKLPANFVSAVLTELARRGLARGVHGNPSMWPPVAEPTRSGAPELLTR